MKVKPKKNCSNFKTIKATSMKFETSTSQNTVIEQVKANIICYDNAQQKQKLVAKISLELIQISCFIPQISKTKLA